MGEESPRAACSLADGRVASRGMMQDKDGHVTTGERGKRAEEVENVSSIVFAAEERGEWVYDEQIEAVLIAERLKIARVRGRSALDGHSHVHPHYHHD